MRPSTRLLAGLSLAAAVLVAACGSAATTPAPAASSAAPAASSAATDGASAAPSQAAGRVSANTATMDELVAALTAAGVPNADRWAREIEEYRPYPTDDATLQKLQDNLAKYNPDPATLAGILSALQP